MTKNIIGLCLFIFVTNMSYSQIDCPDPDPGDWSTETTVFNYGGDTGAGPYGPVGIVDYDYSLDGGNIVKIKIDWDNMQNRTSTIPDKTVKKILEQECAIAAAYKSGNSTGYVEIYFATPCYNETTLYLKLDDNFQLECCTPGFDISDYYEQVLFGGNVHWVHKITQSKQCGYKCCKKSYPFTKVWDNVTQTWGVDLGDPAIQSVSDCPGSSGCTDCVTGDPKDCNGACD